MPGPGYAKAAIRPALWHCPGCSCAAGADLERATVDVCGDFSTLPHGQRWCGPVARVAQLRPCSVIRRSSVADFRAENLEALPHEGDNARPALCRHHRAIDERFFRLDVNIGSADRRDFEGHTHRGQQLSGSSAHPEPPLGICTPWQMAKICFLV